MVRHTISARQNSPFKPKQAHKPARSPIKSRLLGSRPISVQQSTALSASLARRALHRAPNIPEDDEVENEGDPRGRRDFLSRVDAYRQRADADASAVLAARSDSDSSFVSDNESQTDGVVDWDDEERTLVSMLHMREVPRSPGATVVDPLGPAMRAAGPALTRDVVRALLPAVQRVRLVHQRIETEVDDAAAAGYVAFDEACQDAERASLREEEEARKAIVEQRAHMKELFQKLQKEMGARERMWDEYEQSATHIAEQAKHSLGELNDAVEERIAYWDQKSKDIEKEDKTSAKATESMFKSLLSNMT